MASDEPSASPSGCSWVPMRTFFAVARVDAIFAIASSFPAKRLFVIVLVGFIELLANGFSIVVSPVVSKTNAGQWPEFQRSIKGSLDIVHLLLQGIEDKCRLVGWGEINPNSAKS